MTGPGHDVTTLGEGGLRLSVPIGDRLRTSTSFDVEAIGTELNVAGTLAQLGWQTRWISSVHDGPLGDRVMGHAVACGVGVDLVRRNGAGRTGTYFVEYGAPPLPTSVVYDRTDTTFARLGADGVDWDAAVDTRLVHVSGLTAGLGSAPREAVGELVRRAVDAGVPISADVNYRQQLWTVEEARPVLEPILEAASILSCSERDAVDVLGEDTVSEDPVSEETGREDRVRALSRRFGLDHVIMSVGADGAMAYCAESDRFTTAPARTEVIVDRLGAGDGLMAGALHAWLSGRPDQMAAMGTLVAGLAMIQRGEVVRTSAAEVDALVDTEHKLIR